MQRENVRSRGVDERHRPLSVTGDYCKLSAQDRYNAPSRIVESTILFDPFNCEG